LRRLSRRCERECKHSLHPPKVTEILPRKILKFISLTFRLKQNKRSASDADVSLKVRACERGALPRTPLKLRQANACIFIGLTSRDSQAAAAMGSFAISREG